MLASRPTNRKYKEINLRHSVRMYNYVLTVFSGFGSFVLGSSFSCDDGAFLLLVAATVDPGEFVHENSYLSISNYVDVLPWAVLHILPKLNLMGITVLVPRPSA